MNDVQQAAAAEWAKFPNVRVVEVAGLGPVLVEENYRGVDGGPASSATVSVMAADGGRGWLTVRVDAGADGHFNREPNIGLTGTTTTPAAAVEYAALVIYAVQAVLPTLVKETR